MSQKGIYVASNDIKTLYNSNKGMIPSSVRDEATIYKAMINSLNRSYLFINTKMIDSASQNSDGKWSSIFKK